MRVLTIKVNGQDREVTVDARTPLLSVLRDHLHLTGAKPGCGEGQCGACTVLLNRESVRSCITPISDIGAKHVQTIEGLASAEMLHRVQQSFLKHSAFQCGYCTTGMIMATLALLDKIPDPTVEQIREGLNGNLCRCGTYPRIIKAVRHAAQGLADD